MTNRPLKIIRITTWLDFGGVERRFANLSKSSSKHDLIFLALGKGGWAEREIRNNGRRAICLNANPRIPNVLLLWTLLRLLMQERPDVVHTSGVEANFHGILAAFLANVPVRVAEEIGIPHHSFSSRLLFRFIYMLAHKVVGISQAVVNKVIALGEVSKRNSIVVYNPVPKIPEKVVLENNPTIRLITVSRLFEVKNLPMLLQIIADLKVEYAITLRLVGDGPEMAALVKLATELGITEQVTFAGFKDNPLPFLLQSDIFILPSYSEGLSNSLLEAMAVGLPCIATKEGGPSELIIHNENGWLINPLIYEDIRRVVESVLNSTLEHRIKIGESARNYVRDNFTLEIHEEKLFQLYNSLRNG